MKTFSQVSTVSIAQKFIRNGCFIKGVILTKAVTPLEKIETGYLDKTSRNLVNHIFVVTKYQ